MSRLKELREAAGLTLEALGEAVGSNRQQIWKLETGKQRMTVDWMVKLAPVLGVEPKELIPANDLGPAEPAVGRLRSSSRGSRLYPSSEIRRPDEIPIKSAARGGDEQQMFLSDPVGHTQRPPVLAGVRDAYAVYAVGDSMSPRYEPGWLLHVNPFKPPRPGRDVVVYLQGDAVMIKQYIKETAERLILRQFNPEKTIEIELGRVRQMHLIVGSAQE